MQETGHIFLLYELLDSSVRIFYTHMHAYASLGYLICSARGVQNGTFLKAKNTSTEQTSLLNNTTLVFLSPVLRQAVIIYKGRVFGLLFRERSGFFFCFFLAPGKALQHDGWQIDRKLFQICAVWQYIYFYIERGKKTSGSYHEGRGFVF